MSKLYFKVVHTINENDSAGSMTPAQFEEFREAQGIQNAYLKMSRYNQAEQCVFIELEIEQSSIQYDEIVRRSLDQSEAANQDYFTTPYSLKKLEGISRNTLSNIEAIFTYIATASGDELDIVRVPGDNILDLSQCDYVSQCPKGNIKGRIKTRFESELKYRSLLKFDSLHFGVVPETVEVTDPNTGQSTIQLKEATDCITETHAKHLQQAQAQKPIHPLFPTELQALRNPELVYSDHLPVLMKVTVGNEKPIGIISLNMLGADMPYSGFHVGNGWETPAQTTERYRRTIAGLKLAVEQNQVDVITLQEVSTDLCLETLKAQLGNEWEVKCAIDSNFRVQPLITCYRKNRFSEHNIKPAAYTVEGAIRNFALQLRDSNTDKIVNINNVWGNYNPAKTPEKEEQAFRELLTEGDADADAINIVIGDTNSHLEPLNQIRSNITTGAIPLAFTGSIQCADFPDGGFYRDADRKIRQLSSEVLRFDNGEVFTDNTDLTDIVESTPVMVSGLDDSYRETLRIADMTAFKYEAHVKQQLSAQGTPDDSLIVRAARTNLNTPFIAISVENDSTLAVNLQDKALTLGAIKDQPDNQNNTIFHIPIENTHLLHKVIALAVDPARQESIAKVNAQIAKLASTYGVFLKKGPNKITLYEKLLTQLKTSTETDTHKIIKAWENEVFLNATDFKDYSTNRNRFTLGGVTNSQRIFGSEIRAHILHVLTTLIQRYKADSQIIPNQESSLLSVKINQLTQLRTTISDLEFTASAEAYKAALKQWDTQTSNFNGRTVTNHDLINTRKSGYTSDLYGRTTGQIALDRLRRKLGVTYEPPTAVETPVTRI